MRVGQMDHRHVPSIAVSFVYRACMSDREYML